MQLNNDNTDNFNLEETVLNSSTVNSYTKKYFISKKIHHRFNELGFKKINENNLVISLNNEDVSYTLNLKKLSNNLIIDFSSKETKIVSYKIKNHKGGEQIFNNIDKFVFENSDRKKIDQHADEAIPDELNKSDTIKDDVLELQVQISFLDNYFYNGAADIFILEISCQKTSYHNSIEACHLKIIDIKNVYDSTKPSLQLIQTFEGYVNFCCSNIEQIKNLGKKGSVFSNFNQYDLYKTNLLNHYDIRKQTKEISEISHNMFFIATKNMCLLNNLFFPIKSINVISEVLVIGYKKLHNKKIFSITKYDYDVFKITKQPENKIKAFIKAQDESYEECYYKAQNVMTLDGTDIKLNLSKSTINYNLYIKPYVKITEINFNGKGNDVAVISYDPKFKKPETMFVELIFKNIINCLEEFGSTIEHLFSIIEKKYETNTINKYLVEFVRENLLNQKALIIKHGIDISNEVTAKRFAEMKDNIFKNNFSKTNLIIIGKHFTNSEYTPSELKYKTDLFYYNLEEGGFCKLILEILRICQSNEQTKKLIIGAYEDIKKIIEANKNKKIDRDTEVTYEEWEILVSTITEKCKIEEDSKFGKLFNEYVMKNNLLTTNNQEETIEDNLSTITHYGSMIEEKSPEEMMEEKLQTTNHQEEMIEEKDPEEIVEEMMEGNISENLILYGENQSNISQE